MKKLATILALLFATLTCNAGIVIAYQDGRYLFNSTACNLSAIEGDMTNNTDYYVFCGVQETSTPVTVNSGIKSLGTVYIEVRTGDEFIIKCPLDTFILTTLPSNFTLILNCNNTAVTQKR